MKLSYLVTIVFSLLAVFYCYAAYRNKQLDKKIFVVLCTLECVVVVVTALAMLLIA